MRDAGNLLTRAGLAIPTVDVDDIQVHYRQAALAFMLSKSRAGACSLQYAQPHRNAWHTLAVDRVASALHAHWLAVGHVLGGQHAKGGVHLNGTHEGSVHAPITPTPSFPAGMPWTWCSICTASSPQSLQP